MSGAGAAKTAMDMAESDAREYLSRDDGLEYSCWDNSEWARDRLRLVARDRATLQRHTPNLRGMRGRLPETEQLCEGCTFGGSSRYLPDCPEREAVIDYWTVR